jgi:hypothetical protein
MYIKSLGRVDASYAFHEIKERPMSSCSQAPSSPAIISREVHEGVPLLFDVRARGLRPSTQSSAVIGLLVMLIEMGRIAVIYR